MKTFLEQTIEDTKIGLEETNRIKLEELNKIKEENLPSIIEEVKEQIAKATKKGDDYINYCNQHDELSEEISKYFSKLGFDCEIDYILRPYTEAWFDHEAKRFTHRYISCRDIRISWRRKQKQEYSLVYKNNKRHSCGYIIPIEFFVCIVSILLILIFSLWAF